MHLDPLTSRYDRHLLWGTPIFYFYNSGHNVIKEQLSRACLQSLKVHGDGIASGVSPRTKDRLYESPFDVFTLNVPAIQIAKHFCLEALRRSLLSLATSDRGLRGIPTRQDIAEATIDLHESWIHVTHDGGFHASHIHGNCSWCGVYYVDAGNCSEHTDNGVTELFPPYRHTYTDLGVLLCSHRAIHVEPEDGKLLIFPSYVPHSARVYRGATDRIVIAFNARVNRPIGQ